MSALSILVQTEVRLRLRRISTLVAIAAFVLLTWVLIPDPRHGMSLMAVKDARVLYSSSAMAFGSATLSSVLMGLGSFYLVRGRASEDLRTGIGSVIGATNIDTSTFLFARWMGGVAYMLAMIVALMCTTMVLHALRGEGPIQPLIYLQSYFIVLVPGACFGVSLAVLFDSSRFLMGKAGDVLYFVLWITQFGLVAATQAKLDAYFPPLFLIDVSGLGIAIMQLKHLLGTTSISVGVTEFNASAPIVTLPSQLWDGDITLMRMVCVLTSAIPLLLAIPIFHRYSPDRVKMAHARARRSPLAWLNSLLRPLTRLVYPLLPLATRLPSSVGRVLAEFALTLICAPAAIAALLIAIPASLLVPTSMLPTLVLVNVAIWGILGCSLSTRDFDANLEAMSGCINGTTRRYMRVLVATGLLGMLFVVVAAARWAEHSPLRALVLVGGVMSMSAVATFLGQSSRTPRTFLALFLFGLYMISNAREAPLLDWFGSNGVATSATIGAQLLVLLVASAIGVIYCRRIAR